MAPCFFGVARINACPSPTNRAALFGSNENVAGDPI
jgi:hypothetical protein